VVPRAVHQGTGRDGGDPLDRMVDRDQGRAGALRQRAVVEADHDDVVGHAPSMDT
jgi:hypothetical protein